MKKYDWLIVGSGLFGATFAHLANKREKKILVIEKRPILGGNVFCEKKNDIIIHKYGAHIFHTSNKEIWDFVNSFCEFIPYIHQPIANYKGELYNLPFNLNTFYKICGIKTPTEINEYIREKTIKISHPRNLEEQALSLVGNDIYEKLIKGYTEKQWGKKCIDLPPSIIKRIPIRLTFDNNYFNDIYQGIPKYGYNALIDGLLMGIETRLNTDFVKNVSYFSSIADKILYTGQIDDLFVYEYGALDYRTVKFINEEINTSNFQGCSVMNYTSSDIPYTRIIEHKHFDRWCMNNQTTIISKEYSETWQKGAEPYYPLNDNKNVELYRRYKELSNKIYGNKIIFGGRLGDYKYYDMDDTIERAINLFNEQV